MKHKIPVVPCSGIGKSLGAAAREDLAPGVRAKTVIPVDSRATRAAGFLRTRRI